MQRKVSPGIFWVERSHFAPRPQYFQKEDKIHFTFGSQLTHSTSPAAPHRAADLSRLHHSPTEGLVRGSHQGVGNACLQPARWWSSPHEQPGLSVRALLTAIRRHKNEVPPEMTQRQLIHLRMMISGFPSNQANTSSDASD